MPTGGYGTFDYTIDGVNWQSSGSFSNLYPGHYNVQIRDRMHTGCIRILDDDLEITEPEALTGTVSSTNITCNGANDGTISITSPHGGYGTYEYSIDGGFVWQSSGLFTRLIPGSYTVMIRDASYITCVVTLRAGLLISQPAALSASVARTNVTCFGAADGTITISGATGGYGNYEYSVNGGADWFDSGTFTGLTPGFYNVQMRDADNQTCIRILNGSLRITEPAILSANVTFTNITCYGAADGTITISSPSGGNGTYQYSIEGDIWRPDGNFTGLMPAVYNVRIRDAVNRDCFIVLNSSLTLTQPTPLTAAAWPRNVTCNGQNDGTITITGQTGGSGTYQYTINGWTTCRVQDCLLPLHRARIMFR
jgi:hypothetical protein